MNKKCVRRKKRARAKRQLEALFASQLDKYIGMQNSEETRELVIKDLKSLLVDAFGPAMESAPEIEVTIKEARDDTVSLVLETRR